MTRIQELVALIEQHTGADGAFATAISSITLFRASEVSRPHVGAFEPAVCIVAQGRKQMILGETVRAYDANRYLVVSLDIPILTEVVEASPEKPLLCVVLALDPAAINAMMIESDFEQAKRETPGPAVTVSPLTEDLLEPFVRLLRLLKSPRDVPVLAPLIEKELLYRLLSGEQSLRMRQIACTDSKLHQVNRVISWLKQNFDKPMTVETLAIQAGMSCSGLHKAFRAVTGMSPLQYQKQLRLQEARRIMLRQNLDAATVSHAIGYASPTQFNREYRRLFGSPPHRDIARLRAVGAIAE